MLTEQELESVYNLLHSVDEANQNIALAMIEGNDDLKGIFDLALGSFKEELYVQIDYCFIPKEFNKKLIEDLKYKIIPLDYLLLINKWIEENKDWIEEDKDMLYFRISLDIQYPKMLQEMGKYKMPFDRLNALLSLEVKIKR